MRAALAYEWVRLRTIRSTYWLIALSFLFQLLMTMLIAWQLPESGPLSGGDGPIAQLVTVGASSGIAPLFLAYIVGIVGVFSMGHEYRHGMIRATLTAVPNRTAVFAAKLITTAVIAAGTALGCIAIALLNGALFGVGMGTTGGLSQLSLGLVLYTVLFTWSGLAFAALIRNQTAAVAMLMLVPTVIESIIRTVVILIKASSDDPTGRTGIINILKYLPYDAGGKMYTRQSIDDLLDILGYTPFGAVGGGIVFGVFVGALLALAYALFLRRDA